MEVLSVDFAAVECIDLLPLALEALSVEFLHLIHPLIRHIR